MIRILLRLSLRIAFKGVMSLPLPVGIQRLWLGFISETSLRARNTTTESASPSFSGQWVRCKKRDLGRVILYLHGGGYTTGSADSHKAITSRLAVNTGASVLALEYRLAPENPYPAGMEDALRAYRNLLQRFRPQDISFAGDSAGAGLVLSTVLALMNDRQPLPASIALISPWTDLSLSGESVQRLAAKDPMLSTHWLRRAADAYRSGLQKRDARISPLFAELRSLPPLLIQVGADEILLSDSERLAANAKAVGVDVTLEIEPDMWHDYQIHGGLLDVADQALVRMGQFMTRHWESLGSARSTETQDS